MRVEKGGFVHLFCAIKYQKALGVPDRRKIYFSSPVVTEIISLALVIRLLWCHADDRDDHSRRVEKHLPSTPVKFLLF